MSKFQITQLAIPSVSILIAFLSYSSQYLFLYLEPKPLEKSQLIKFNILLACLWICYIRACIADPGHVPKNWKPPVPLSISRSERKIPTKAENDEAIRRQRWCRRCEALKPPRAHHCRTCQRCIPKMDHHCPWTANCVSHRTFPHFIRFLFYSVVSMIYLESFLYVRGSVIWNNRHMPSYLGPTFSQLAHLFVLMFLNTLTLFALVILLVRSIWMLAGNQTTIEGWEVERHRTLLRRARVLGGYLDGPDGIKIRIKKQEFPYDIGIWQNLKAGMGGNPIVLEWFWPLAATPELDSGLKFDVNGFEDESMSWPPPDPDRMNRYVYQNDLKDNLLFNQEQNFTYEEVDAFRQRQQADYLRQQPESGIHRRKLFHKRYTENTRGMAQLDYEENSSGSGEESWRDSEGDRLHDFGVDEVAEFYDEDDIPLAQLIRQRRVYSKK